MKRLRTWLSQKWRAGNGRPAAAVILAVSVLLLNFPDMKMSPFRSARVELFDKYQNLSPRQPQSQPVVIVEIDEATLGALGQWPWPRNYFAALIDAIAALKPAAVGLDIIMPEPDHASPQAVAESRPDLPEKVRAALISVASNDHLLATSFAGAPIVLGAAGFPFRTFATQDGLRMNAIKVRGNDPLLRLNSYPYVLASLPEFQAAAHGQALLSSDPENGIVRRAATLSNLNGTITPGLSLEMLRIAHAVPGMVVDAGVHGVEAVNIGAQRISMQGNGEAWVHYDKFSRQRSISALSLLKGEVPPERIAGKMVLVGLTGLGLQDLITTPLGDRRPGVEVHAQLIESFEDGHFLTRPWWMLWVEIVMLISLGVLLIWIVPHTKPEYEVRSGVEHHGADQQSAASQKKKSMLVRVKDNKAKLITKLALALSIVLTGAGLALFRWGDLLFDAASLLMVLNTVLGSLFSSYLIETEHHRKNAESTLLAQRIKSAQIIGELDAAHRIQVETLPVAETAFPGENRFEIAAMLEPARQAGGNLYDFFMIDERQLFFIIGDVSGKGLSASLFMVVAKALVKNAALRGHDGIGAIITLVNRELARENPEKLFLAAVAGILDVENGTLEFVNAGHDAPWRISASGSIESVKSNANPPLCVAEEFNYPVERLQLAVGDRLLLLTDGITKAMNASKELYGVTRVSALLNRIATASLTPNALVAAMHEDICTFVGDTEPSDDQTLLVLRRMGNESH